MPPFRLPGNANELPSAMPAGQRTFSLESIQNTFSQEILSGKSFVKLTEIFFLILNYSLQGKDKKLPYALPASQKYVFNMAVQNGLVNILAENLRNIKILVMVDC